MSPAVVWIAANEAEGRVTARVEAPLVHHADLVAAGYAPEVARAELPAHVVVTDADGVEWAANLPAVW